jgi:pimeloyl-ACP methyl ester carboxylesterase
MFDGMFSQDETYNYEVLRALSHIPYGGADTAEVLATARRIVAGDDESWYREWRNLAQEVSALSDDTRDAKSRGLARLRASNYWRTAEFFLEGRDPRSLPTYQSSVATFRSGLAELDVEAEYIDVPYGTSSLTATWYPAPASNGGPVLVIGGGYDSTEEELWFAFVAGARERGYDCLTYSGPGQGAVIRERGQTFVSEWERPVGAVLDALEAKTSENRPVVLLGWSLGGYLAPRAAAFDPRVDAVVAHNVYYDFFEAVVPAVPEYRKPIEEGDREQVNQNCEAAMKVLTRARWGIQNGMWTMGCHDPYDYFVRMREFTLEGVAEQISCDVFVTAGSADHFVPLAQLDQFQAALTRARSVTTKVYDEKLGGGTHCQTGATHLWQRDLFDWLPTLKK